MAIQLAACAAAMVKSKAKAKSKATAKAKASPLKDPDTPSRSLQRRDTAEQAERAIQVHVPHIPRTVWASRTNAKGENIKDFVEAAIREKRLDMKKLGARFWSGVLRDFNLVQDATSELDPPSLGAAGSGDGQEPTLGLMKVLGSMHNDNAVKATAVPLERFMNLQERLSPVDTFGILRGMQVCPQVTKSNSVRAAIALMKFWGRTVLEIWCFKKPWSFLVLPGCSPPCVSLSFLR